MVGILCWKVKLKMYKTCNCNLDKTKFVVNLNNASILRFKLKRCLMQKTSKPLMNSFFPDVRAE